MNIIMLISEENTSKKPEVLTVALNKLMCRLFKKIRFLISCEYALYSCPFPRILKRNVTPVEVVNYTSDATWTFFDQVTLL